VLLAAMELMGEANWWMPRWLARILPRIDVDGTGAGHAAVPATAGASNGEDNPFRPTPEPTVPDGV
jgi:RND superfamily putative drug exporter